MKSKFSNEDGRFKIDERFVESSESSSEGESDEEEEKGSENDEEKKPNVETNPKKLEKKLRKEKEEQFKILESITGKPIVAKAKKTEKKSKPNQMVRYDPTKEDHKMFEILSEDEEEKILKPKVSEEKVEEKKSEEKPAPDPSQFTQVEANLKDLFCSKDIFKFKFDNFNEDLNGKNEEEEESFAPKENKLQKKVMEKFKAPLKNAWSSESEDEEMDEVEDERVEFMDDETNDNEQDEDFDDSEHEIKNGQEQRVASRKPTTFLPDFDSQIKESLRFFICTKSPEELRQEWRKKRESMVQVQSFFTSLNLLFSLNNISII